jgi:hypothetical protein
MTMLFLDWSFSFEAVCRVIAWSIIVGFFGSLGCALFGYIPRRKVP